MAGDDTPPMNYETYILPHELPDVRPREVQTNPLLNDPDEAFFIRTHQAFEVWFAQILDELGYARRLLAQPAPYYVPESDIPAVVKHIRRAASIFDLVREHLPVLETLDTTSFYKFRKHIFGAGGTQSYRFRELEWLMGLLDKELVGYTKQKIDLDTRLAGKGAGRKNSEMPDPVAQELQSLTRYQDQWNGCWDKRRKQFLPGHFGDMQAAPAALQRRMLDLQENGSLRHHAMTWLDRTTFPAPGGARPQAKYSELFSENFQRAYMAAHSSDSRRLADLQGSSKAEIAAIDRQAQQRIRFFFRDPRRRAIVFLLQFADQPLLAWPASLVEALLELEQAFSNWRDRHIAMVARVLGGGRISTMGAAGSGLGYLRATLQRRVFPEIWDARSFMLSDEEAAGIYTKRQLSTYGFLHEKRAPGSGR
jgi:tryptophan 2,3-dioxygenase